MRYKRIRPGCKKTKSPSNIKTGHCGQLHGLECKVLHHKLVDVLAAPVTLDYRLIQRPVHQSFGLVKCTVGLVKNGVFGTAILGHVT